MDHAPKVEKYYYYRFCTALDCKRDENAKHSISSPGGNENDGRRATKKVAGRAGANVTGGIGDWSRGGARKASEAMEEVGI